MGIRASTAAAAWLFALGGALALAACSRDSGDETVDIHRAMKEHIDPRADALWEISNRAIAEDGGIDPGLMTPESWAKLAQTADELAAEADRLASAKHYVVAPDGALLLDEDQPGGVSKEKVRANIAADPEGFARMARSLADHARITAAAARARDAAKAGEQVIELDHVCEGCHLEYWYPQLKAHSPYQKVVPQPAAPARSQ